MSILLVILLSYGYSPGDSCRNLITLGDIPERSILFAELAAKDGGRSTVELADILEMAGRFSEAEHYYSIALNSAIDPLLREWLENRISGCTSLDTLIVLETVISNTSAVDVSDILIEIPLPESHPPYQRIEYTAGLFMAEENLMRCRIDLLPSRTTVVLPLILHITQQPYSFRPLQPSYQSMYGSISLEEISSLLRTIRIPVTETGPGPCLETAYHLKETAAQSGLEFQVTGGLLRSGADSLLFHAWNLVPGIGIPIDAVLFSVDSLRGIGHCPTDLIPLWNFEYTDGHEVSIFYPNRDVQLTVSMRASYGNPDIIEGLLNFFPLCLLKEFHLL